MKFTTRFLSLVLTLALTFSSVVSLSIRVDGNGVVSTSETDILDRSEIRNALMAPRDVELVRRASWTYNNSMFCHIIPLAYMTLTLHLRQATTHGYYRTEWRYVIVH